MRYKKNYIEFARVKAFVAVLRLHNEIKISRIKLMKLHFTTKLLKFLLYTLAEQD